MTIIPSSSLRAGASTRCRYAPCWCRSIGRSNSVRYAKIAKFVERFFANFDTFLKAPRHPKWREVNFAATLEGWKRSPLAQSWIDRAKSSTDSTERSHFDAFLAQASGPRETPISDAERADLFRAFIEWNKAQPEPEPELTGSQPSPTLLFVVMRRRVSCSVSPTSWSGPVSLTERLAAAAPTQPEPTPTTMAERFAPEGQKAAGGGVEATARGARPAEPPVMAGLVPERSRPSSNRGLLVASMLVSLVPTAIILALMWQGAIRMPGAPERHADRLRARAVRPRKPAGLRRRRAADPDRARGRSRPRRTSR